MVADSVEYYECILKNLAEKILRDCADKCDVDKELYQLFRNLEALLVVLYYYDPTKKGCLYVSSEILVLRDEQINKLTNLLFKRDEELVTLKKLPAIKD